MSKVRLAVMVSASAAILALTASPSRAADGACVIDNARLVCADGARSDKAVLEALASDATAENLKAAFGKSDWLRNARERELYRRSVEGERAQARRYADQALQSFKRRRMSKDDYAAVRASFEKAMDNYEQAITLYRSGSWYSPARDKNAEGND